MINSRVDFYGWNYWSLTKGIVPNVCERGFGDQAISLEVRGIES